MQLTPWQAYLWPFSGMPCDRLQYGRNTLLLYSTRITSSQSPVRQEESMHIVIMQYINLEGITRAIYESTSSLANLANVLQAGSIHCVLWLYGRCALLLISPLNFYESLFSLFISVMNFYHFDRSIPSDVPTRFSIAKVITVYVFFQWNWIYNHSVYGVKPREMAGWHVKYIHLGELISRKLPYRPKQWIKLWLSFFIFEIRNVWIHSQGFTFFVGVPCFSNFPTAGERFPIDQVRGCTFGMSLLEGK